MTTSEKVIWNKVGLLGSATQLGGISQARQIMG